VRARMQRLSSPQAPAQDQELVGTLVEADFERNTARLRLPAGSSVDVSFSAELSDDIHEALRSKARLVGVVQYNPRTSEVKSVLLRALHRTWGPSLRSGLNRSGTARPLRSCRTRRAPRGRSRCRI